VTAAALDAASRPVHTLESLIAMQPAPVNVTCSCGRAFACGAATGHCWCFDQPNRLPVPTAAVGAGCLCPDCLAAAVAAPPPPRSPVEGAGDRS
jgi:hypothetical protein